MCSRKVFIVAFVLRLFVKESFSQEQPNTEWWKTALLYQIYPRSFYDTDGDGVGDIKGVTAKLQYLKDTGIDATWLSPIFKSPQRDFGYDVSDFLAVDPLFGTNDDLEELFAEARKLGLRIVLDFVPNHSSVDHEWFKQSELGVEPYRDYYVWHPGRMVAGQTRPDVPNNWNSVFYGSAWEWSDIRQEYYLHQFEVGQPDLNFRNPKVIAEFDSILTFWMERGASGFRVDAINHMFEDALFRDEPINDPTDPLSYGYTHHIYTNNLLETYDVIGHWRKVIDDYVQRTGSDTIIMLTEAYTSMDMVLRFYQSDDGTEQRAHFPFNFVLLGDLNGNSNARDFKYVIDRWLENLPRGKITNWVLGNHDQPRVGSRYGQERIDAMNLLLLTLPGVAVTYNGEEIGMVDYRDMSWEDSVDPQGCNVGPEQYRWKSRDPQRTPFQWDDGFNGGFSLANKTWLPMYPYYRETNLRKQLEADWSHYRVYTEAAKLRRHRVFREGHFRSKALNENVFAFVRYIRDDSKEEQIRGQYFVIVINLGSHAHEVDLLDVYAGMHNGTTQVYLVGSESRFKINQLIDPSKLVVGPYESIVLGDRATLSNAAAYLPKSLLWSLITLWGVLINNLYR
ncbi:AGAP006019-PA-like protein [Anopheles sinensis]|uniref:alpha-glucosidase n=1 Tax=Anopheles sinensis TaxID=74873 RepID=A0A084W0S1_ANOSI|nr:AGAP006019-PA-like protein [Anopheles sinensis]